MTPFQQLRLWASRASVAERATASFAAVIALALVVWLVTPVNDKSADAQSLDTTGTTSPGQLTTGEGTNNLTPTDGSNVGSGSGLVGSSGSTGANAGSQGVKGSTQTTITKQCPPTADQGVTASEIKLAISIINIAGAAGNDALNVPAPQEQREDWQWVADSINASGGAACRKLSLTFYDVNPISADDVQRKCLAMANSKPFLAADTGALTGGLGSGDCIPQQKIPLVTQVLSDEQIARYYPYFISIGDITNNVLRDGILAMKARGFFDAAKGFKKLGVAFTSCRPGPMNAERKALAQAGLTGAQIVEYNLGCPAAGSNTAADFQQAVLAFQNAGVTHVTEVTVVDFGNFSKAAARQGYKPVYIFNDNQLAAVSDSSGQYPPDAENFDGALNFSGSRYGEASTPGFVPATGTARCNAIFKAKNRPTVYKQGVGYGGVVCSYLWFIAALLDNAPELKRSALVSGMRNIGTLDHSFPVGPTNYAAVPAGSPWGRGFWRAAKYVRSCACWQVPDPAFQPGFS